MEFFLSNVSFLNSHECVKFKTMKYFDVSRNFQVSIIIFRGSFSYISTELYIFIASFEQTPIFFNKLIAISNVIRVFPVWLHRDSLATFNTKVSLPLSIIKPAGFLLTHVFTVILFYSSTVRNSGRPVSNKLIINYSLLLRVHAKHTN